LRVERGIGFQYAVIDRIARRVVNHLDHAKTFVHRFEQRAIALLAGAQGRLHRVFLGDVTEHQHRADDCVAVVADRRATVGNRIFAAIAGEQQGIVGKAVDDALGKNLGDGYRCRCERLGIHDMENLGHWLPFRCRVGPAGQPFGHRVQTGNAANGIGDQYAIADRVQRDRQVFLAGAQVLFRQRAGDDLPTDLDKYDCQKTRDDGQRSQQDHQNTPLLTLEHQLAVGQQCRFDPIHARDELLDGRHQFRAIAAPNLRHRRCQALLLENQGAP